MESLNTNLIEQGGLLMWPLLALSILGFILFIERALYLHRGQIRAREFLEGIKNLLNKRRLLEALTVCEETPGPVAHVTKAALLHHDQRYERMLTAVQASALVEIPVLERRIGTIASIAKIAPLLGLLGTVVAMLQGFNQMGHEESYATASSFSALIAQALISSATGLTVAIMAYAAHHFLHGRVRAIVHDMEWVGNDIIDYLLKNLPEEDLDQDEKGKLKKEGK
jgi:biopolymer transport protein ExbB